MTKQLKPVDDKSLVELDNIISLKRFPPILRKLGNYMINSKEFAPVKRLYKR